MPFTKAVVMEKFVKVSYVREGQSVSMVNPGSSTPFRKTCQIVLSEENLPVIKAVCGMKSVKLKVVVYANNPDAAVDVVLAWDVGPIHCDLSSFANQTLYCGGIT